MTALYSVNLHIAGRANLPIFNTTTIFNNGIKYHLPRFSTVQDVDYHLYRRPAGKTAAGLVFEDQVGLPAGRRGRQPGGGNLLASDKGHH